VLTLVSTPTAFTCLMMKVAKPKVSGSIEKREYHIRVYNEQPQYACVCLEGGSVEVVSRVHCCLLHLCGCGVYTVDTHLDTEGWNVCNNAAVQASGNSVDRNWDMLRLCRFLRGRWVLSFMCYFNCLTFIFYFTNKNRLAYH